MELPVAFCDEMKRILGDEYEDYLKSMEGTRKFGLRVNTAKISAASAQKHCLKTLNCLSWRIVLL